MTKRVFRSIFLASLAVLLAAVALILGALYTYFSDVQAEQLRLQTALVAHALETEGVSYFDGLDTSDRRITWIAADGTVLSVTNDELMGTTVCITHSGGYVTKYSSLQENPPISQGQQLKAGDIVGYVGTAAAEATMGPHLHFAVEKDGTLIDPKEYVK